MLRVHNTSIFFRDLHAACIYHVRCVLRMAPAGSPPSNGGLPPPVGPTLTGTSFANYKRTWWRRVAPCLAFLAAFSTAMVLLLVWSEAAALR